MARRWMKNPKFGTVVLPTGKVLSRPTDIVEGDHWAKMAHQIGLVELLEEPKPAPIAPKATLLVDEQPGARVMLTEIAPDQSAPVVETPAAPTATVAEPSLLTENGGDQGAAGDQSEGYSGTSSASIDGSKGGARRRRTTRNPAGE